MGRKPEGNAEKSFKRFGKRLDTLLEDFKSLKDKTEDKYADEINELKRNRDKLIEEIKQFKENNSDKIDELEKGLDKVGNEIKDLFNSTFNKDGKETKP